MGLYLKIDSDTARRWLTPEKDDVSFCESQRTITFVDASLNEAQQVSGPRRNRSGADR
jgi:hypothetical protein